MWHTAQIICILQLALLIRMWKYGEDKWQSMKKYIYLVKRYEDVWTRETIHNPGQPNKRNIITSLNYVVDILWFFWNVQCSKFYASNLINCQSLSEVAVVLASATIRDIYQFNFLLPLLMSGQTQISFLLKGGPHLPLLAFNLLAKWHGCINQGKNI